MNEEIHDFFNILLCISFQNDTAHYIKWENNSERFTVLKNNTAQECDTLTNGGQGLVNGTHHCQWYRRAHGDKGSGQEGSVGSSLQDGYHIQAWATSVLVWKVHMKHPKGDAECLLLLTLPITALGARLSHSSGTSSIPMADLWSVVQWCSVRTEINFSLRC